MAHFSNKSIIPYREALIEVQIASFRGEGTVEITVRATGGKERVKRQKWLHTIKLHQCGCLALEISLPDFLFFFLNE